MKPVEEFFDELTAEYRNHPPLLAWWGSASDEELLEYHKRVPGAINEFYKLMTSEYISYMGKNNAELEKGFRLMNTGAFIGNVVGGVVAAAVAAPVIAEGAPFLANTGKHLALNAARRVVRTFVPSVTRAIKGAVVGKVEQAIERASKVKELPDLPGTLGEPLPGTRIFYVGPQGAQYS